MKSQKSDMNKIMQDAEEKRQQEIADLESRSKQLYELVATENFTVDEVVDTIILEQEPHQITFQ